MTAPRTIIGIHRNMPSICRDSKKFMWIVVRVLMFTPLIRCTMTHVYITAKHTHEITTAGIAFSLSAKTVGVWSALAIMTMWQRPKAVASHEVPTAKRHVQLSYPLFQRM